MSKKDKHNDKKDEKNDEAKFQKKYLNQELLRLQLELVKLQYWVKHKGLKLCILLEGRDAAGKGGIIKRIMDPLNPRGARIVALTKPTDTEKNQWYFQRYIEHFPTAGEIVIFDRSWYNRAGVEKVMGFCTDDEYREFLRSCPEFERMLVRSGIILVKYWITVDEEEQERRFRDRAADPAKRWKLSDMDLASWDKWDEYSRAKDVMIRATDITEAPWFNVDCNNKQKGRLNCIAHLLSQIPYKDIIPPPFTFSDRQKDHSYIRPPKNDLRYVPELY